MITKERLEELIEQGATIYHLIAKNYEEINANDIPQYKLDKWELYKEYYFETEEDAEFALEIRTSKIVWFKPPLYEEFLKLRSFGFVSDDDVFYCLYYRYNKIFLEDREVFIEIKVWKLNKENYLEACRLCKKLFLGEEV